MKRFGKLLGLVAVVAIMGFSLASCGGGSSNSVTALNGTWVATDLGAWGALMGGELGDAGYYELYNGTWRFATRQKGTFTVDGSTVTFITTHWGVTNWTTGEREWELEDSVDPKTGELSDNNLRVQGITYTRQ